MDHEEITQANTEGDRGAGSRLRQEQMPLLRPGTTTHLAEGLDAKGYVLGSDLIAMLPVEN